MATELVRDITEKKRAEQEHLKVQKLEGLGTIAGGIAHDFNNLLTGIFGNIEIVKKQLQDRPTLCSFLETAHSSLQNARQLTAQLLTFATGGEPVWSVLDLSSYVREIVEFNKGDGSIVTHYDIADDLWLINADKGQIGQVISNLVINARQAMNGKGNLFITLSNKQCDSNDSKENSFIVLEIRDDGEGMPEDVQEKMFDPYFTTKQVGNGLGLAVTHGIVSKHNGKIIVDSEVGKGTSFKIYLPADRSLRCPAPKDSDEKQGEAKKLNILSMDDEKVLRELNEEMFADLGHSIKTAEEGEKALKLYKEAFDSGKPFDLVFLDLTVASGIGGKDTAQKILEIDPAAKLIVCSGYSSDTVVANYADYGFSGKLAKPYDFDELEKEIKRVMNERK